MTDLNRSTRAQRERTFIALLDQKLELIRQSFCDQLYTNESGHERGFKVVTTSWRLGMTDFHFTYGEIPEVPGTAGYRIRQRPYKATGVHAEWAEIQTLGDFDGELRRARNEKGHTAADLKAVRNGSKHHGEVPDNLILVGLSGSQAYGLAHNGFTDTDGTTYPPSDADIRGVFVTPTRKLLMLPQAGDDISGVVQKQQGAEDAVFDEVERFLGLCLKCNPERLELLAHTFKAGSRSSARSGESLNAYIERNGMPSELNKSTVLNAWGFELACIRNLFLTRQRVFKTYGGYAKSQLARIERKKERHTKPAMHLIRLMITGIRALETGSIDCDMSEYRDRLLDIRKGLVPIEEVFAWHQELEVRFAAAYENTSLPEDDKLGWEAANELLLRIRREHLSW